ncbi:MAG: 8-oxo-dGTP diphosphatase MutT [Victivallaceae bacterium]
MKLIKVCAALVFNDGKVLLSRRPSHQAHAGYWEFPGGKLEPGESPAQCLQRELKEELDIDVAVYDTVYMLEHEYPGKSVSLRLMRCSIKNGREPVAMERQEYAWVERRKLSSYDLLPADRPIAEFLTKF